MEKRIELDTKVKVIYEGKPVKESYTCALIRKDWDDICLEIKACEGTSGVWRWYLKSLFPNFNVYDSLSLEYSQNWYAVNMGKVYKEIISKLNL
jgi:hypothetical protein